MSVYTHMNDYYVSVRIAGTCHPAGSVQYVLQPTVVICLLLVCVVFNINVIL